jgi:hypothetical protein
MRFCRIMLGCFIVILSSASLAQAEVDWRFPVGLTYITGLNDIKDQYKDNIRAEGYEVDELFNWPVGITFNPYVEFDYGLCIGGGIGPFSVIMINKMYSGTRDIDSSYKTSDSSRRDYFCIPVNLNVGYSFLPKASISPYIKAGIAYPVAWGDYIQGRSVGFLGAVGVEFMRKRMVGIGIEIAVDTSTVSVDDIPTPIYQAYPVVPPTGAIVDPGDTVSKLVKIETKDIKPIGTSLSIFVVF